MLSKSLFVFLLILTYHQISARLQYPKSSKDSLQEIEEAISVPIPTTNQHEHMKMQNRVTNWNVTGVATCKDGQISNILNNAMAYYIHNMDQLTRYVLDQLTAARKPGKWLVHAQIIAGSRQGPDWQTSTNGDVFRNTNWYACYYHDTQTYILVLRLY